MAKSKKDRKRELEVRGRKAELIVIGGGDGTISKALPQLLKLGKPFAVLPLGVSLILSSCEWTRSRQPKSPSGRKHRIDVGLANGHPYLNVASVGIASRVAARQSKDLKQKWRVLAYTIALLRSVRDLKPFFVQLDLDSSPTWSGWVYQVSVGNGRYHGGGLKVAEDAAIDDGKLDLYLIYPGRLWQLATSLIHLKFGISEPAVLKRLTAVSVSLRTYRPRPVDADGELVTKTPTQFELHPKALTEIVPHKRPLDSSI